MIIVKILENNITIHEHLEPDNSYPDISYPKTRTRITRTRTTGTYEKCLQTKKITF